MPAALVISGLRGELDPEALAAGRAGGRLEALTLRLSAEGLSRLLPPGTPLEVDRITGEHVFLRGRVGGLSSSVAVRPWVSSEGRLVLTIAAVRAGPLSFPAGLALRFLAPRVAGIPGVALLEGEGIEIDFPAAAAPLGLAMPPAQSVTVLEGAVELRF